jgi:hypothetical protein
MENFGKFKQMFLRILREYTKQVESCPNQKASDYIYKLKPDGQKFLFKRDSQVATDKDGEFHEVPKGSYSYTDSKGKIKIKKHFSSDPKRKSKNAIPSSFGKKSLSQRQAIKLTEDMAESEEAKRIFL